MDITHPCQKHRWHALNTLIVREYTNVDAMALDHLNCVKWEMYTGVWTAIVLIRKVVFTKVLKYKIFTNSIIPGIVDSKLLAFYQ